MNRILLPLLFATAACTAEDDWQTAEAWGGVDLDDSTELDVAAMAEDQGGPPVIELAVSQVIGGQNARATVGLGIPQGYTVHWAFSITGPGVGPCPPGLNGTCVGLDNPFYLGASRSTADGYATKSIAAPAVPNGLPVWVQAAIQLPNGRPGVLSPVVQRTVGPSICPAIFAPVCGVNGTTYDNDCTAEAAGWLVDHAGPC